MKILKGVLNKDHLGKPYIEYVIEIAYNSEIWRVNRKFNQIANLHKTLKNYLSDIKFPESSVIFSKIHLNGGETNSNIPNYSSSSNNSSNFHENKIKFLEKYLKDISEIEVINKTRIFRRFFDFPEDNSYDDRFEKIPEFGKFNTYHIENNNKNSYIQNMNREAFTPNLDDNELCFPLRGNNPKIYQDNNHSYTERPRNIIEESQCHPPLQKKTNEIKKIKLESNQRENKNFSNSPLKSSNNFNDFDLNYNI